MITHLRRFDYLYIIGIFILTVTILGFITPGYDHFTFTVSLLATGKYKAFYTAILVIMSLYMITKTVQLNRLPKSSTVSLLQRVFVTISIVLLLIAIFPTNLHNPNQLILSEIKTTAWIHYSVISIFYFLTPIGIYSLYKNFNSDPYFQSLSKPTLLLGFTCFILVALWIYFYLTGSLPGYLGLLQKIIILINLAWFGLVINKLNSFLHI